MKIIQNDPNSIQIKNNYLMAIIIGLTFIALGIWALFQSWLLGILFIVGGAAADLFVQSSVITFDRSIRQIVVRKSSLIKKEELNYQFGDVARLELRPKRFSDGGTTYGCLHILVFKDGQELDLSGGERSSINKLFFPKYLEKARADAQKLADFLSVQMQEMALIG